MYYSRVCSTQEGGESNNEIICFVRVVKGFFLKACSEAQPFSHHQFTFQLCFKSSIHIKTHIHITTSGAYGWLPIPPKKEPRKMPKQDLKAGYMRLWDGSIMAIPLGSALTQMG
jgi:hypothetical protein